MEKLKIVLFLVTRVISDPSTLRRRAVTNQYSTALVAIFLGHRGKMVYF